MSSDSDNSFKVSKYNSAVAQLMRLDNLWQDCHRHSRSGKYVDWNADLDCVWRELAADLKEGCDDEKRYNDFTKELGKIGQMIETKISGFNKIPKDYNTNRAKHYQILNEKETWLKRLQNKLGKGTAYDETIDEYMEMD